MLAKGYADVSGATDGSEMSLHVEGALDGENPDIALDGSAAKTGDSADGIAPPPAASPAFRGLYVGDLGGSLGGIPASGSFTLGIADLAASPYINGISLYAANEVLSQALSLYGEGSIASLNPDGSFSFRADADSVAKLVASNLLPGGYVIVGGSSDGQYVYLTLAGRLDGSPSPAAAAPRLLAKGGSALMPLAAVVAADDVFGVDLSGQGEKISADAPGLGAFTPPPAIVGIFNGSYSGAVSGTIGTTDVSGNFHMGIRDLSGSATINALSLFASEIGWAEGAAQGLSVYGGGELARLAPDGTFRFRAGQGGAAGLTLAAHGLNDLGYVDITGGADDAGVSLGLSGLLDGDQLYANLGGSGGKDSSSTPILGDLPTPPAIVPPEEPPVPPIPPAPSVDFSGRYDGAFAQGGGGMIGTTPVYGAFHLGIKNLASSPTVSALSLFVSEIGWDEGSTQGLAISGEGSLATLDANGAFTFRAGQGGVSGLTLAAHGLIVDQGYVTLGGSTDGSAINLALSGTLDGASLGVSADGSGSKDANGSPELQDMPPVPSIVTPQPPVDFSGRYDGAFAQGGGGMIGTTPVFGDFHLGIKNLSSTPTVSALSLFVSEIGWAEGSTQGLAISGEGSLATLDANGAFTFRAGEGGVSGLTLAAHGLMIDQGYVTLGGSTDGSAINLALSGTLDGGSLNVSADGSGSKDANGSPELQAMPPVPSIVTPPVDFSGRYEGASLSGTIGTVGVTGGFYLNITGLANSSPYVSALSLFVSERGWAENALHGLSLYRNGTQGTLDADGAFRLTANASGSGDLALNAHGLTSQGSVVVTGSTTDGKAINLALNGNLNGADLTVAVAGAGSKTSPDIPDVPQPPTIAFTARYDGTFDQSSSSIDGTSVSGKFHLGIQDLQSTPYISAISLFISEKGWPDGTFAFSHGLSLRGQGNFGTIDANGFFNFDATGRGSATSPTLAANDLQNGSVHVGGSRDANGITLDLNGYLDGANLYVYAHGSGSLNPDGYADLSDMPAPPSINSVGPTVNFSGRYDGTFAQNGGGAIGTTPVYGDFHLGVKNLADSPTVSALSLFVSEIGWAEGSTQGLAISGKGTLATLNANGEFTFTAGKGGVSSLTLAAHGLTTDQGYVTLGGSTDGSAINLALGGTLDGASLNVSADGSGSKTAGGSPELEDMPQVPSIVTPPPPVDFSGRYEGVFDQGVIGDTAVTGAFYLGVKNLSGSPTVSDVALMVSELGWAEGARHGLTITGSGDIAGVSGSGVFNFRAGESGHSGLKLAAHGLTPMGYVTVGGATDGTNLNLDLAGDVDGADNTVSAQGAGSKTASEVGALPIPPSIFSGRYAGALEGNIGNTGVTGEFHLRLKDISNEPKVSDVSLMISEDGWAENSNQGLSIHGSDSSAGFAGLDSANGFSFRAGAGGNRGLALAAHDLTTSGFVDVSGTTDGSEVNLALSGSLAGNDVMDVSAGGFGNRADSDDGALPTPPAIAPRFSAVYSSENLAGEIADQAVTGKAYLGIKDLSGTPTLNAVSIFVSEKGWADGALNALAIYGGGGNIALSQLTPDDTGSRSTFAVVTDPSTNPDKNLTIEGHHFNANSRVYVEGSISSVGDTPNLAIYMSGDYLNSVQGTGNLVGSADSLPKTPDIVPLSNYTGVYGGTLAGTLVNGDLSAAANGQFNIGIGDISGALNVTSAEFSLQSQDYGIDATVKANSGMASALDMQKNFNFTLDRNNAVAIGGSTDWNLGVSGSINPSGQMSVNAAPNQELTSYFTGTLTGTGSRDTPQSIPNLPQ
jgi:hypothetical protein